jgi:manganese/zinc/iron transport system substrate-binding protein
MSRPPALCVRLLGLFAVLLLVAAAAGVLPSCSRGGGAPASRSAVCTTGMVADVVRIIAGERLAVTGLMGEGVDPHLYKPSPGDARLLEQAGIVFYNGLALEGRMGDVLVRLARAKPVIAVTDRIDESLLHSPPEFAGHHDPHVWFDVSLWARTVDRVRDALCEFDPAGAPEYTRRAAEYRATLDALHGEVLAATASIPKDRRVLVTAHDAFGYFASAYDFEVHGIQGISTESEASVRDVNALVDLLVSRRIPAVFVESSVPARTVEALVEGAKARGHAVRIGGELFSDAMGAPGTPEGTYVGMVRHNVSTIVAALSEPAP